MTDAPVLLSEHVPNADHFIVMRGDWATYDALLAGRGGHSGPRIAYLDGVLQIMSPSYDHEMIKGALGDLVKAYCFETKLPYSGVGSWTLRDQIQKAGLEPDECFIFGDAQSGRNERPERPDLAIEVIWTSGGIEKLEIHRRLGVAEVWFWENYEITVHVLRDGVYEVSEKSVCLPDLGLALLARLAVIRPTSDAVLAFREALRQAGGL